MKTSNQKFANFMFKVGLWDMLPDEIPARPKGRYDVCSVTQCAFPICKYYKQCCLNCVKLEFSYSWGKFRQICVEYMRFYGSSNDKNTTSHVNGLQKYESNRRLRLYRSTLFTLLRSYLWLMVNIFDKKGLFQTTGYN